MNDCLRANWPAPSHVKTASLKRDFIARLSLPAKPFWLKQTHSNVVTQHSTLEEADAVISKNPNEVCAVLTADCLPILICNKQGTEVAAIHAGWRGIYNDIITNTIHAMDSDAKHLLVWFGPAISAEVYEVGQTFYDKFIDKNSENSAAFTKKDSKWFADLYQLANLQLKKLGIKKYYGGNACTYSNDQFYSYRRNPGEPGRMASLIWFD